MRVVTLGSVPLFRHDGLVVTDRWTEVNVAKLSKPARAALMQFTGQLVRIHPDDHGALADAGLELYVDQAGAERLRDLQAKPAAKPKT